MPVAIPGTQVVPIRPRDKASSVAGVCHVGSAANSFPSWQSVWALCPASISPSSDGQKKHRLDYPGRSCAQATWRTGLVFGFVNTPREASRCGRFQVRAIIVTSACAQSFTWGLSFSPQRGGFPSSQGSHTLLFSVTVNWLLWLFCLLIYLLPLSSLPHWTSRLLFFSLWYLQLNVMQKVDVQWKFVRWTLQDRLFFLLNRTGN